MVFYRVLPCKNGGTWGFKEEHMGDLQLIYAKLVRISNKFHGDEIAIDGET